MKKKSSTKKIQYDEKINDIYQPLTDSIRKYLFEDDFKNKLIEDRNMIAKAISLIDNLIYDKKQIDYKYIEIFKNHFKKILEAIDNLIKEIDLKIY